MRLPSFPSSPVGVLARRLAPVAVLVAVLAPLSADAQGFGRVEDTKSNVAYFYHARPGEATVQISVWGTVPRPGIYEVPDTTDLDKLLTMAGGAPIQARQENREPARISVRVYRPQSPADDHGASERSKIFEASMDQMLAGEVRYLRLRDDDIVVVETIRPKQGFSFRDVLSLASTLGTLTLLALRIFDRT